MTTTGIPGILSNGHNEHVEALKRYPWNVLPDILGSNAERALSDLFINCGVFTPVGSSSNLIQQSGIPLHDLNILPNLGSCVGAVDNTSSAEQPRLRTKSNGSKSLSRIRFVRHRILYARPLLNAKQNVRSGLNEIHVLNRCHQLENAHETLHVMKYIFPAQFGLHNVLKSEIDVKDTSQMFKDYTLREQEIARQSHAFSKKKPRNGADTEKKEPHKPRRLRGKIEELIHALRKRHQNCSYGALLNHYCPRSSSGKDDHDGSIRHATELAQVSAFCRAVVAKVFPSELWGSTSVQTHNLQVLNRNIDRFIRLRRYEGMSLHDVLEEMKITEVGWLAPTKISPGLRLSRTDFTKRKELLCELFYYIFDSFLIPLIRGHFHVTESNVHRNRLFFFRHDVWKDMSEPALTSFKECTLEECGGTSVKKMLAKRSLGVSHVRLLPKEHGMRPIINLRRRAQKLQNGRLILGKSINSILTPAFSVLNYEKSVRPSLLGSTLLSVDDIFPRLQAYRESLVQQGLEGSSLYFAKVDVQSCFDTIPQKRLLELASTMFTADHYQIKRYSRAKLVGSHNANAPGFGTKPSWKFLTKAAAGSEEFDFHGEVETDIADGRSRTTYVNGNAQRHETRRTILALLEEHIGCNLIRIGKRFYRQKEGIPQGSIVSSLLCSYFYTQLEREVLGFVENDGGSSILLRLIDDFLVITTQREVAEQFMTTMHAGVSQFGVQVKAAKSRANFDIKIAGESIARLPAEADFPYCGIAINTVTLNISKDQERRRKIGKKQTLGLNTRFADRLCRLDVSNSVTVEFSSVPGQTFYRKTLK